MGLLDLATNPAVRFSRSGMPDAVEPLRPLTAAEASLRTHRGDRRHAGVREKLTRRGRRSDRTSSAAVTSRAAPATGSSSRRTAG